MKNSTLYVALISGLLAVALAGCGDDGTDCGPGTVEVDGECVPNAGACGDDATFDPDTGKCEGDGATCATGTVEQDGECVPDGSVICETGTTFDTDTGTCVADITGCAAGTVQVGDECVPNDDTLVGDVTEPAEPNDPGSGGEALITLPDVGDMLTIEGCITPYVDADDSGNLDGDLDTYVFTTTGPVLIDITVDGLGGLAGGFQVGSTDQALIDSGWFRFGLNMVADTSRRKVFIPSAGTHYLLIGDSRAFLTGEAAGGADTCYFATISQVAIPAATPITGGMVTGTDLGDAEFYSYDPDEGDILFESLTAPAPVTAGGLVVQLNGAFDAGSAFVDFGEDANLATMGLADADTIVVVVDYIIDYGLSDVPWTLEIIDPGAQAAPADGTVTITHDASLFRWLYFDVNGGEVINLDITSDTGDLLGLTIVGPGFSTITTPCGFGGGECAQWDGWVQFVDAGRYYIRLFNIEDPAPATYGVSVTRTAVAPGVITIGTEVTGATLANEFGFHELDVSAADWITFQSTPTNFDGDVEITLYDRTIAGELGIEVPDAGAIALVDAADEFGAILVTDDSTYLLALTDGGGQDGDETYNLDIVDRVFTDLGTVTEAAPVSMTDVAITAGAINYYLLRAADGFDVDVSVTGTSGTDPVLSRLDDEEVVIVGPLDDTAADGTETFNAIFTAGWVAFTVTEAGGAAGTYDVGASGTDPVTYTATAASLSFTDMCPGAGGPGVLHTLIDTDDGISVSTLAPPAGFELFGASVTELTVSSNGWVTTETGYAGTSASGNSPIPSDTDPNSLIAPYWDDLDEIVVCTYADSGAGTVTIQWEGVSWWTGYSVEMQAILHGDGTIDFVYGSAHSALMDGVDGTVGIEHPSGLFGNQLVFNTSGFIAPGDSWTLTID